MKKISNNIKNILKKRSIRITLITIFFLFSILFLSLGRFLIVNEAPVQSDAIIVLSGGRERIETAYSLYEHGYSDTVILSNSDEKVGRNQTLFTSALNIGIPPEHIIEETLAESTSDNAVYTKAIMLEEHYTSAIIVSSDYHMRRVKMIFDRVYKDSGITLTYVSAEPTFSPNMWWGNRYGVERVLSEYVKMVGNTFGFEGPDAKEVLRKFFVIIGIYKE